MVADAPKPATNFINRNIQKFVPTQTRPTPCPISIKGVSVIFCKKKNIRPATRIHFEKIEPVTEIKRNITEKRKQKKKTEKTYCGIRRTSIRSKQTVPEIFKTAPKPTRTRWVTQREILSLPVTQIPAPDPHPTNFGLFLNLARKSWKKYDWPRNPSNSTISGNRTSEALDKHPTTFVRLLKAMETSLRHTQSGEGVRNQPINNALDIDSSYEQVYQRHVDTLNSVIAQNPPLGSDSKRKRKGPPKLEIKIAPVDQYVNTLAQNIEELNCEDNVDNCGDLTPVITFNHVSTVSTTDQFQYSTVSPGTSSKGSRSPSPLLEVPSLIIDISTKFPTV